jgi:hypothetical protein
MYISRKSIDKQNVIIQHLRDMGDDREFKTLPECDECGQAKDECYQFNSRPLSSSCKTVCLPCLEKALAFANKRRVLDMPLANAMILHGLAE